MTALDSVATAQGAIADLPTALVGWLETGMRPEGLFSEAVFVDLSLPHWRVQVRGDEAAFRLREEDHPAHGTVRVEALDPTDRGFLIQFEERWEAEGQHWYCRELIHAVVTDGCISELVVYCTGDWDEAVQERHAVQVHLLRP